MDITLPSEFEPFIQQQVESGRYFSPGEVVRDALHLLQDRERLRQIKLQELRKEIALGVAEGDAGLATEFNEETLEEIKTRGQEFFRQQRKEAC
jgi:antitoxin ParD1/3/4